MAWILKLAKLHKWFELDLLFLSFSSCIKEEEKFPERRHVFKEPGTVTDVFHILVILIIMMIQRKCL